jgi:4-hydroxy-4-methyl-2-oxoglutarate aldolase
MSTMLETGAEDNDVPLSEVRERLGRLYSAVVCDALDSLDFRKQALSSRVRPLFPAARVIGRARTLASYPVNVIPENPYQKELEALDTIVPDDVLVLATNNDYSSAVWGELLSVAANAKGATGAITDGLTRDASRIIEMKFPVFAAGMSSYDSRGRSEVTAFDVPVECDGVSVHSNDLVFGDFDGVVIIPRRVLAITLETAEKKARSERIVEEEFKKGRKVAEVFAEHGIL